MRVIIDRFEGKYVVCEKENKDMILIEKTNIPEEAVAGDVLLIKEERIEIDYQETQKRKERIKDLMKDLWD